MRFGAYFTVTASNCNSRFFCVLLKQEKPQVWKHISHINIDLKSVHYIRYCSFSDHQWTFRREPDFHFLLFSLVSVSSAPNPGGQSSIQLSSFRTFPEEFRYYTSYTIKKSRNSNQRYTPTFVGESQNTSTFVHWLCLFLFNPLVINTGILYDVKRLVIFQHRDRSRCGSFSLT